MVVTTRAHDDSGNWQPMRINVSGLAITDTEAEALAALDVLKTNPVLEKSVRRREAVAQTLEERAESGALADPVGFRYAADNIYTNASAAEFVPHLRPIYESLPSPRSHIFWMNWGPVQPFPDMALSVQGDIYFAVYSVWSDPKDDERMLRWPVEQMRKIERFSIGGQMNDENMVGRRERYLSPQAERKLEALRAKHDPNGVFLSYLT